MTSRRLSRAFLITVAILLLPIGFVVSAGAQTAALPGRFAVSGTAGLFWPSDSAMRDVYGSRLTPLTGQVEIRVLPDVSLFGGVEWFSANGQSVIVGAPVTSETYSTSLTVTSIRAGAEVSKVVAPRWTLAGGGGAVFAAYTETWPDAGRTYSGRSNGFLVLAEVRYAPGARWAVIGRVDYSGLGADVPEGNTTANLGGVHVSAGVRFVF